MRGANVNFKQQAIVLMVNAGAEVEDRLSRALAQEQGEQDEHITTERTVKETVQPFLEELFTSPSGVVCVQRRALLWALSSPSVAQMIATGELPTILQVRTVEEAAACRTARLADLREDTWKRRRHLCLDRALWRKQASAVVAEEKRASSGAGETE
jgi:hypothetical protein